MFRNNPSPPRFARTSEKRPVPPAPSNRQVGGAFKVAKAPSAEFALTNCILVAPQDFPQNTGYIIVDDAFVFSAALVNTVIPGTLGTSGVQREWARWSLNQMVTVAGYDPFRSSPQAYLGSLDIELEFLQPNKGTTEIYDGEKISAFFKKMYKNQIFAPGQKMVMDFRSINLKATIRSVQCVDLNLLEPQNQAPVQSDPFVRGILTPETDITFYKSATSDIRIKPSSKKPAANAIIAPNFKFEDMGIGGLDTEFSAIFRRAFASRIFPPGLVDKLGIQHVKGILLFGPPGTGKTLMARQIGKMLNAREPKVVNGPEILNKFVGQSEENVRKLFADAEKEYKEKGEESGLHIIIFDELDAICKQRGSTNSGTGVGDSVVNQLLAKMDGVDQLNNILLIGMTNRKDLIDEALLRPGRLEVHMEISLPDEFGRRQILKIHTLKMRDNGIMENDVNLEELASLTKNFSGAEIGGLVKSATSFAFNRHVKVGTLAGVSDDIENMKVSREDFMNALQEVRPAFGVSEEELEMCIQSGILKFSPHIDHILKEGHLFMEQVRTSAKTPLVSVLLHGPPCAGKTALAATIAMSSEFPFIKLLSPDSMVGFNEASKVAYISKVFMDSYKSPMSVIVVDNIERLLDWVPIGPRFSNSVLQTLMVLLRKQPPKGNRLLIIATTTERSVLAQMDLLLSFDYKIGVPNIMNTQELSNLLKGLQAFSDTDRHHILGELESVTLGDRINVGVKRVLNFVEAARQDTDIPGRFVEMMADAVAEGSVN
ncbi:Vesicular-fusion protein sec18 [Neolecta irregularis DAH-3]|uniref:Vesicular-fusion protein SEC18 n=1 Tax=Neolecta irregularis (strain DAH-3) TaxID=1198029 RepID=A0A1U7LM13_NEOID|nr:Vesicular-fusion protein sec18 [Neolecta irregularis DAH-3]|eukprot:OLL23623.1 Vesicular-fusion protein sec18 [Neolecta irregularis DAH-3]